MNRWEQDGTHVLQVLGILTGLLHMKPSERQFRLAATQHGDSISREYTNGLPANVSKALQRLLEASPAAEESVVVCHSEPGAWGTPLYNTVPCPALAETPAKLVGRT
eukprot:Sspe_Gene.71179::Locus_42146_Transcript_3_6_Confidence_0.333_Length_443::g.71179::m.71179